LDKIKIIEKSLFTATPPAAVGDPPTAIRYQHGSKKTSIEDFFFVHLIFLNKNKMEQRYCI